jgi:serine protease AprX
MKLNHLRVPTSSANRRRVAVAAVAVLAATGLPATASAQAAGPWSDVVVTGSSADGAAQAVHAAGGRVLALLPITHGVAAQLPPGRSLAPEWLVAPQRDIKVAAATTPATGPATTIRQMLGLPADGSEGRGVTVAVVDTGIAQVPDLAGRVSARVDLSGTGAGDGFGHGTFMAGLIAGSGAASDGAYRGVAPLADLVDVKVADAQGSTDLITVLRGLQWVSDHGDDVDVVNLSLSSDSPLPYQLDPLTQALESLWQHGITVVVPSGNDGPGAGTVTSPGNDPMLLTTGGLDAGGTATRTDDVVGDWSGRGPTWQGDAKPDLVAAGGHVVSLRSPGSVIDVANPSARIGTGYFRGSGTSMATAVTSGVIAAALSVQPRLAPDSVKNLVTSTTYASAGLTRPTGAGAGGLNAKKVISAAANWKSSRKQVRYDEDTAAVNRDAKLWATFSKAILDGDKDAATKAWAALSPESRDWAGRAWAQLDPAGRAWAGRAWAGRAWAGADSEWAGRAWAGRAWAGRAWASDDWAGRAWAGMEWTGRAWASDDWTARAWASDRWTGRAWAWLPSA